jgi:hypothetical protein
MTQDLRADLKFVPSPNIIASPRARHHLKLVSHRHQDLPKVIMAWHQARESPSVFARSDVTDAAAPELFVPVVLGDDPLVARSQEQGAMDW